jgi:hypothetical protein
MENTPYNRNVAEQLKAINQLYLSHLNKTGKQVVDSDLVPLVAPNTQYEGSGIFSGLLGSIGLGKSDIAKLKGAGVFDDIARGFTTGFKMPFQVVNKILGGAKAKKMVGAGLLSGPLSIFGLGKEGGLIKIAKGKAHYGKQSKTVVTGNGVGRAVGCGNAGMEGAGIFDDIGDFVKNVTKVALPIAKIVGIGKKGGKRGRPRKAGAVGVEAMAEHRNALTGGGPLSGLLGAIGLGEEKKAGKKRGRPSKKQMEAGGLFDDVLGHVGKVVSSVPKAIETADKAHKLYKGLFGGKKSVKSGGAKKSSPWIAHCKAFAKKHNMSYRDALRDARCKSSYKK